MGCGDCVVNWEEVGDLGVERVEEMGCFIVVQWGIFGGLNRRFFRMSVVE